MPRKGVLLAVCLIPLVACLILSRIRCIDQCDSSMAFAERSRLIARALIDANFTDISKSNFTGQLQAPIDASAPSVSAPPPPTPVAAPPPTPIASPPPTPAATPTAVPTSAPIVPPQTPSTPTPMPSKAPVQTPKLVATPVSSSAPSTVSSPVPVPSTAPLPVVPSAAPINTPRTTPYSTSSSSLVVPILDCIVVQSGGVYTAHFSYENESPDQLVIPIGKDNKFSSPADNIGQPTTFSSGRSALFPASVFTTTLSQPTTWQLTSYALAIDPQDTSVHCKEEISLVITVTTIYPPNSSFVDAVGQVISEQFNVSVSSLNVSVTLQQNGDYDVHVVISTLPGQLEEAIKKAKEIISDPDVITQPLKNVLTPDINVVSVRGDPTVKGKQGIFEDRVTSSSTAHLWSYWYLVFVLLFVF